MAATNNSLFIESDAAVRLDRLPWLRFHTLIVSALGITWLLDGLEVTLAGSLAPAFKSSPVLHFSDQDVGESSSAYLLGAVVGALLFGWLTDRYGRRKLFFITLGVYILATAATAFSMNFASFTLFRFLTGVGIAANTARSIQPSRSSRLRAFAARPIWPSMAPFGWAQRSVPVEHWRSSRWRAIPTLAGAYALASARYSA